MMSRFFFSISQTADVSATDATLSSAMMMFALASPLPVSVLIVAWRLITSFMPSARPALLPASMYATPSATCLTRNIVRISGACAHDVSAPRLHASKAVVSAANQRSARTALGMTRVTIGTVVNIVPYTSVVGVRDWLVVSVARQAREHRVVGRIGMAIGTASPFASMLA